MDTVLNSDRPGDLGCTDWTLHDDAESCWITVGRISVYIRRLDEGAVSVQLFDKGDEARDYIDGCYAEPRKVCEHDWHTPSGGLPTYCWNCGVRR